ncbi:MAG: anti-sigma factor [Actinomycetota bacterium]|nr:anti-sigma factor [Actinomycetota bacterium]
MNDQLQPTQSDDLHALTGAYAVDAVDDVERARFERHLETCTECRDEVTSLQAAASELAHLAQLMPPAQLRERVLSDIAAVRPLPPAVMVRSAPPVEALSRTEIRADVPELEQRRLRRQGRQRRGAPRWLAVAAAAVVLVGGGGLAAKVYVDGHGSSVSQGEQIVASKVLDDPAAARYPVRFLGGASAEIVTSASQGRAVIVTKNLPDAPGGKVYQLWFQRGGAFYSAGLMSNEANQVTVLDGNANGAAAVGITEEPAGGSAQPTTKPVALISLA